MIPFDWHRLLLGVAPWSFMLEVLARVVIVYALLVLVVRLLGRRLSGRIGNQELAVMLALGAIIAVPIQDPARGVLPGLVLLVCLLALQRGLSALGARHPTMERLTQNGATLLVANGVIALDQLSEADISANQLFAVLRGKGLSQLGQARRVYLEAYGCFSVIRREPAPPGLSLLPSGDERQQERLERAPRQLVCSSCGTLDTSGADDSRPPHCPHCRKRAWVRAVAGS